MKTVKKGNVTKNIDNEKLLADYILAGWKLVEKTKPETKSRIFSDNENV